ncbi:hypothetical protein A2851_00650 [Candidatus Kaiserbacteria bacterium RIFCSPHIGHO2_01_FULL_53_29]|uniref:Uncharacterized protein n=1 Tax=Candidatus Kaiserbacteria bacterium RIFCSPHIGHO2_01_FULL_53_29 TaxID=1798480 RepID=A0A1F6CUE0_9BACT|nr:MAG: hypothetical protein A2851_00650 [Candidatus Kaiserbacteria bacterium RIFCSPHIGHO2_01_FULL_53_29]
MNKELKRVLVVATGIVFVILGIVGFALPFLQGILFLAVGLILLSISSARIRTWLESHTRRYPKIHKAVEKMEKWITSIIGRVDEDESPPSGKK